MTGYYYVPLGYVQIAVGGTVCGLTGTAGQFVIPVNANRIIMSAETAGIRWRDDGQNPTGSVGFLLSTGLLPFEYPGANFNALKFLSSGAPAVLNVAYYFDPGGN